MNNLSELAYLHESLYGNSAGYGIPSTGEDQHAIPYPKGHFAFDPQGAIALPGVGVTDTILSFVVPVGYDGLIESMSNVFIGGGFNPSARDIVWRLLADGRPMRNFEAIYAQKGSLETPRPVAGIRIYSGQTITLEVEHIKNAALNGDTAGSLSGYFYPSNNQ